MSKVPSEISGVVWFTAAVRVCELGCGCVIEVGDTVAHLAVDDAVVCLTCGERAEKERL